MVGNSPEDGGEQIFQIDAESEVQMLRFATRIGGLGVWYCCLDTGERTWSPLLREIFGLAPDCLPDPALLRQRVHPEDRQAFEDIIALRYDAETAKTVSTSFRFHRPGNLHWQWAAADAGKVRGKDGRVSLFLAVIRDVTQEKRADARLQRAAVHDTLTGLPNREFFSRTLGDVVARSARDGLRTGLLVLDVDHLKTVNDKHGHYAGDALLVGFARRLRTFLRSGDILARLGGDEFGMLIADASHKETLPSMASRIQKAMQEPFFHEGIAIECSSSIGGCRLNSHCPTAETLMKGADLALGTVKATRRGGFAMFSRNMRREASAQRAAIDTAHRAISQDLIRPFYQPKVDLVSGRICGFEALMRWRREKGAYRSVSEILPALGDPSVAAGVSEKMFDRVLADIGIWRQRGLDFGSVALNFGELDLKAEGFADWFLQRLKRAGAEPREIQIEVVESVFLGRGAERVTETVLRLHASGIAIALDDFGTGYAALSHLQQYPVDLLKIDRSFVQSMSTGKGNRAIIRAIVDLSNHFEIDVVAEGIETTAQADHLRQAGCRFGQGFLYSRAVPARDVPALLERGVL